MRLENYNRIIVTFIIALMVSMPFYGAQVMAAPNDNLEKFETLEVTPYTVDYIEQIEILESPDACIKKHEKTSDLVDMFDNEVIETLEGIVSLLKALCTIVNGVETILSAINTVIGDPSGGCCMLPGPLTAICTAISAIYRVWHVVYMAFKYPCCIATCGTCKGNGECGGLGGTSLSIGGASLNPEDSIYVAMACLCIPGILMHMKRLKLIYQAYNCCISESCAKGYSTATCERELEYQTCMFWEGGLINAVLGLLANIILGIIAKWVAKKIGNLLGTDQCSPAWFDLISVPMTWASVMNAMDEMDKSFDKPDCNDLGFDNIEDYIPDDLPVWLLLQDTDGDGKIDTVKEVSSPPDSNEPWIGQVTGAVTGLFDKPAVTGMVWYNWKTWGDPKDPESEETIESMEASSHSPDSGISTVTEISSHQDSHSSESIVQEPSPEIEPKVAVAPLTEGSVVMGPADYESHQLDTTKLGVVITDNTETVGTPVDNSPSIDPEGYTVTTYTDDSFNDDSFDDEFDYENLDTNFEPTIFDGEYEGLDSEDFDDSEFDFGVNLDLSGEPEAAQDNSIFKFEGDVAGMETLNYEYSLQGTEGTVDNWFNGIEGAYDDLMAPDQWGTKKKAGMTEAQKEAKVTAGLQMAFNYFLQPKIDEAVQKRCREKAESSVPESSTPADRTMGTSDLDSLNRGPCDGDLQGTSVSAQASYSAGVYSYAYYAVSCSQDLFVQIRLESGKFRIITSDNIEKGVIYSNQSTINDTIEYREICIYTNDESIGDDGKWCSPIPGME